MESFERDQNHKCKQSTNIHLNSSNSKIPHTQGQLKTKNLKHHPSPIQEICLRARPP